MYYLILILFLVYVYSYVAKDKYKLYKVQSTIDKKMYLVEKSNNEIYDIEKANILANTKLKIDILIKSLSISDERRILMENKSLNLQERDNNNHIGYTINKGDSIGLCIDDDENTLFFVVLHELSHVITKTYGHDEKFWNNFKFLIQQAVKLNIYDYKNYNKKSANYCKKDITYTPYKK